MADRQQVHRKGLDVHHSSDQLKWEILHWPKYSEMLLWIHVGYVMRQDEVFFATKYWWKFRDYSDISALHICIEILEVSISSYSCEKMYLVIWTNPGNEHYSWKLKVSYRHNMPNSSLVSMIFRLFSPHLTTNQKSQVLLSCINSEI